MATAVPQPKPGILDIEPYVPGESSLPARLKPIKLSSNETPLGPEPEGGRGLSRRAGEPGALSRRQATALRACDCARVMASTRRASCAGRAPTSCSTMLAHAYLGPGDEGIFTEHGFLVYRIIVLANGATPVVAPETNSRSRHRCDPGRVTPRTKVVFLANPNNPTGTYISFDEVRSLRAQLARERAAGARRRLCRVRAAQRLRGWPRAGRHDRRTR